MEVVKFAYITKESQDVNIVVVAKCANIVLGNHNVKNAMVVQYVSIISLNHNVKNAMVVQYVSITSLNHNVQSVMVPQYVNQEENHIKLDVGREATENMAFFVVLLICFRMILKQKAFKEN